MGGRIIIACGDPAGVGPEIIEQWVERNPEQARRVIVAGSAHWLEASAALAQVERVAVGPADFRGEPGKPSQAGARVAWEALECAARYCKEGRAAAAVTGPVSKAWMQQVGFPFPGQTEFFADRWGGEPVMAFAGAKLRVVLATWHVPLAEVSETLDEQKLERAVRAAHILAGLAGIQGGIRIGVCGLNPHAGEEGLLGSEERDWIDPLLNRLRRESPGLSDTQPGDTIFWRALRGEFDVVIALYHDQGLAPLKTIDFEESVNLTLGLPFLRTSPDHGTAFGIAGQGSADGRSFARAVELALVGQD